MVGVWGRLWFCMKTTPEITAEAVRVACAMLLGGAVLVACAAKPEAAEPVSVNAAEVEAAAEAGSAPAANGDEVPEAVAVVSGLNEHEEWVEVPATLRAWRRSRVAAEESGRITSIAFEEGATIREGTVLVQLDDSLQKFAIARDEAAVEVAKVEAEARATEEQQAERDAVAMEEREEAGVASDAELREARGLVSAAASGVSRARAELVATESTLKESRRRLDRCSVKAPFTGMIVAKHAEMGEWVEPGTQIAEIIDVATLEVRLDVPEAMVYSFEENKTKLRLELPIADASAEVVVQRVVREVDPLTGRLSVRARIDNRDGRLVPGMRVVCRVKVGEAKAEKSAEKANAKANAKDGGAMGEMMMK